MPATTTFSTKSVAHTRTNTLKMYCVANHGEVVRNRQGDSFNVNPKYAKEPCRHVTLCATY